MPSKSVRVPIAVPYNTRAAANNATQTAGIWGLGIWGTFIWGNAAATSSTKDGRMINCMSQTVSDPITGEKKIYCVKRPGWDTTNTPASGNIGNAIHVWAVVSPGTKVMTCFGGTNSTLYDGTTSKGAITGNATEITETFIGANATLAITSTDNTAWYYDNGATVSVATKIVDADFPGNNSLTLAGTFAHIDGYAVIMDTTAKLWASDLNSITSWTATSFGSANSYPDSGIGCIRYKQYIMAFGTQSVEFFYNAGQTPFPFLKSPTMTVQVGCISARAIAKVADTVFWCGSTPEGGLSVFSYDGGVQRISPPEIDGILTVDGAASIKMTSLRFFGRSFVIVMATLRTFVYCIEEKAWHEWNTASDILWYRCSSVSTGAAMYNYGISNTSTSGKVYQINPTSLVFTDDGNAYSATAQLLPMDFGTKKRKFWESVEIVCDIETAASATTISYYDDDYQTLQNWGNVDLSNSRPLARRLGSSRRREWVITNAANTPMTIEAIEIEVRLGSS